MAAPAARAAAASDSDGEERRPRVRSDRAVPEEERRREDNRDRPSAKDRLAEPVDDVHGARMDGRERRERGTGGDRGGDRPGIVAVRGRGAIIYGGGQAMRAPPREATGGASAPDVAPSGGAEKPAAKAAAKTLTGGVYCPPFKLAQMMRDAEDKTGAEYQRMTWDALKKSINGIINKVNVSNIANIVPELFAENLVRGRGLFARSVMKSQMASPTFSPVYASMVAVVNTKFPAIGELVLRRVILQFRRAYKRNDKPVSIAAAKFLGALVNQQVAHELIALEVLTLLLARPTDDGVEVALGFVRECGYTLSELSPQGLHSIFERFRGILHEGAIDKRVQFMIEGLFALRKGGFEGAKGIPEGLDLVEAEDQIVHELSLDEEIDPQPTLDVFKIDSEYAAHEAEYAAIKKELLGDPGEGGSEGGSGEEEGEDEEHDDEGGGEPAATGGAGGGGGGATQQIVDNSEANLVNLRRTIYLTIMSSLDFEEAGHKLLKIQLGPGQEMEICTMLIECCSQEKTFVRYYGLLAQRFAQLNRAYRECFESCFVKQYQMIHRLETNKLRNVAKFYAHLVGTDALPWTLLSYIQLTEDSTTSSSRIFIKILMQELAEALGLRQLAARLADPALAESVSGLFPRDAPKNSRFAVNFFTSIGLGGLTDALRAHLINLPKMLQAQREAAEAQALAAGRRAGSSSSDDTTSSSSSDSDTSSSSSGTDSDSSTSSSDSEDDRRRARQKRVRHS